MSYRVKTHRSNKPRCGLPLGGLGAGWFEIRQDGTTARWNIFNNAPLGSGPVFPFLDHSMLFFIARWQYDGEEPRMKLFQIEESHDVAGLSHHEIQYIFPWMTGVETIDFEASFPFARFAFRAPDMPFEADLTAWSPFIPFDAKNSALPGAFFDFTLRSAADRPMTVTLAASFRNGAAFDVPDRFYTVRTTAGEGRRGFEASCGHVPDGHATAGTSGLASLAADSRCFLGWAHPHHFHERFIIEDDFPEADITAGVNKVDKETGRPTVYSDFCWNTIAVQRRLERRGDAFDHTFIAAWHFPNLHALDPKTKGKGTRRGAADRIEGHYYGNFFANSAEVADYLADHRADLLARTRAFHAAFFRSDAPRYALDQVNSQMATLFTSSWFTREGNFGVIEGLGPEESFAGLSTTDVAMFGSPMYAALFPELSRRVNRAYARFQRPNGVIAHSIVYNFAECCEGEASGHRLDLPAQFVYLALRDFFWSNDEAYLREIYEPCRAAVEYVLRERDKNGDGLPDMEGVMCSYDNFPMYGVSSFVAGQFVLALKALAEAARRIGRTADAERYGTLFERGREKFDRALWNGEYYRLSNEEGGRGADEGCLSDQLIAQWAAHQVGLGHLFDPDRTRAALKGVLRHNFRDWQGLRNCQWPADRFIHPIAPNIWVDQANTCWTGVELEFSALLIYEGLVEEGLNVLKTCDDRHRTSGMYFDHQEFGGHYFRPLSAWSNVNALLGLEIRGGTYTFAPRLPERNLRLFFAAPDGWGHYRRRADDAAETISIRVEHGALPMERVRLALTRPAASVEARVNGRPARRVTLRGAEVGIEREGAAPIASLTVTAAAGGA
jgi:uncharacterized protein (DUF608 family)